MIQQILYVKPDDNPTLKNGEIVPLELSIITGDKTFVIPSKLTKDSINDLFVIYKGLGLIFPAWRKVYALLKDAKFEPLIEELPMPDEDEGTLYDLRLESGDVVKFLVRTIGFEPESLIQAF